MVLRYCTCTVQLFDIGAHVTALGIAWQILLVSGQRRSAECIAHTIACCAAACLLPTTPLPTHPSPLQICGKFVPAGTILHLSTFLGQVLTDPRLDISSLSPSDLTALYNNWALITPDTLSVDFQPERWLVPLQDNLGQDQAAQIDPSEVQMGLKSPDAGPDSSSNSSLISSSEGLQRPSGLLTFSAGPHACLGYSLFMAEAKVLLSVLARGYTAEPVDAGSLNFKTNFLTLLRQGTVKFAKQGQPLPIAAAERVSSSASNTAAQAAEEAAVAV